MGKNIHVTPIGDKWQVKPENSKPTSLHRTQQIAIKTGKQQAVNNQSELVIHGKNGRIRDKDSFGNDKFPPKDKRH